MSRMKKNVYYALAFIVPIALSVLLIYWMNEKAVSDVVLRNAGKVTSSVINQALFIFALEAYGLLVMMCFNRYFSKLKIVMLSFVVGTLVWCLSSVVIVCIGIAFKWYYVALLCFAALVALYFVLKPEKISKEDIIFYAKTLLIYVALALFFAAFCVFRFSYDSYMYINTGQKIAKLGYISKDLVGIVSGFSLFTPMLFSPSVFFDFDFSQGVYILLNVQFTVFVGYAVYEYLIEKISVKKAIIAGALSFLAIASSNIYFEMIYWPLSNLITTMTMFGMLYFSWRAQKKNEGINMLISAFFAVCFVLTRSENMLLYVCFMFILSLSSIKKKNLALHIAGVAVALLLWYIRFFLIAGFDFADGAFLTAKRAAQVLGVLVLFIVYVLLLSKSEFVLKRKKLMERIFFIAMALAIVGIALIKPDFFVENSRVTLLNIFYDGAWAGAIMTFAFLYFVKLISEKEFNYFDRQSLVFILFFIIIFLLRDMSLRVGYGDSGSRYFAHILPILIYNISTTLGKKI